MLKKFEKWKIRPTGIGVDQIRISVKIRNKIAPGREESSCGMLGGKDEESDL